MSILLLRLHNYGYNCPVISKLRLQVVRLQVVREVGNGRSWVTDQDPSTDVN